MPAINEFLYRVRQSSPAEICYRMRRALLARMMKHRTQHGIKGFSIPEYTDTTIAGLKWPELVYSTDIPGNTAGIGANTLNLAPQTIAEFEKSTADLYISDIALSPDSPDIRQVWEPARLQHVVQMIVESRATSYPIHRQNLCTAARTALIRWIDANPFLMGPHYLSPMECGLRIPVFLVALKYLDAWPSDEQQRLWKAAYSHAWWVFRNLSLYNSLGNHTICEAVGLIFAGAVYQEDREGPLWLARGIQLLENELEHQINPDGGPAEQSLSYHRFLIDLYCYAADFLQLNGLHDCRRLMAHLKNAEVFLAAFDNGKMLPAIGDSDDGRAVATDIAPRRPSVPPTNNGVVVFEKTGYTAIRTKQGALLTFDHGPLGMPPLYNHGHADALAITLAIDGVPFLIDPGTYRYNGVSEFRRYFKGTRAHNTVAIDHQDQAFQQSSFIWRHPFHTRLLKVQEQGSKNFLIEAQHDGYRRLTSPVQHRRRLTLTGESRIAIMDRFEGNGEHTFALHYHLHPDVHAQTMDNGWRLSNGKHTIFIALNDTANFEMIRGQENPLLGWYSPVYGKLQKCGVLRCQKTGSVANVHFETRIETRHE